MLKYLMNTIPLFLKYSTVGVINTIIHWFVFILSIYTLNINQTYANLISFLCAATFSFFANAKFTFNAQKTTRRYILFMGFMGSLSILFGYISDIHKINPLYTIILFSLTSLFLGFIYLKFLVFKK
ncbi:GtrA family protein [Bisgaard Taxon 45]